MVRHGLQQGAPITSPRRIAIVTSSYPANAADPAGAFIPGFAAALSERNCLVTVLTPQKSARKEIPDTHEVRWFEWAGSDRALVDFNLTSPGDLWRTISLLRAGEVALGKLIAEEQIDACLALWAIPAGYLAWRLRRRAPYSVWALGSDIHLWARRPVVGTIIRIVLRGARRRFADGVELAGEVRRLSGLTCDFLPTARRLPTPARLPSPLGSGINFLYVGRLEAVKGADIIVEAAIALVHSGLDVRLTVCGTGSMYAALQKRIVAARATERVRLVSDVPADVVAALMAACDCLVVPSRNESIPVVFSESLQAGIPPLVTDVGDMGDLARKHGLASPVRPGDSSALAAAMRAFAADLHGQRARYEKARAELRQVFDVGAMADRYLSLTSSQP